MSDFALRNLKLGRTDLKCPRDHTTMKELLIGSAFLDECTKCHGRFFDTGEMFAALGIHGDPSYWDRPECVGSLADAPIHCPRCDGHMTLISLQYEGEKVDIDRCGHCLGVWLDQGEADRILAIGRRMEPIVAAERDQAKRALAAMGEVDFRPPGLIASFLALFRGDPDQ